mmetsp:Transcript_10094/g.10415  ORF Transcript_10094/g.10415 Transcript_10094/m.10415 type:complete len:177 (-) Transcript_10094:107-637(-)
MWRINILTVLFLGSLVFSSLYKEVATSMYRNYHYYEYLDAPHISLDLDLDDLLPGGSNAKEVNSDNESSSFLSNSNSQSSDYDLADEDIPGSLNKFSLRERVSQEEKKKVSDSTIRSENQTEMEKEAELLSSNQDLLDKLRAYKGNYNLESSGKFFTSEVLKKCMYLVGGLVFILF